jgi:PIN domain nuclease of toxin-antitoxin system
VTVLDATAVIAALLGEPARSEVESLLRQTDPAPKLSSVNLAEVLDKVVRIRGLTFDDVLERLYWLGAGGLETVDGDLEIAGTAGFLRGRHYDPRERAVSLADCFALATASVLEEPLATSDPALCAIARYEEIEIVPLPDSTGRRPT